ncbi:MAG: alkyl hydroperoxide reductase subunit F [Gammaproteobacteria bacterium]|nr:alkyl hydroperoxide reductase subunit F [Gammaproteobacteria bacterium]
MITAEIKQALSQYFANLQQPVRLVLQTGEHAKRAELVNFLSAIGAISDNVAFEERDTGGILRSPVSFLLEVDGEDTGIVFSGIPGGHEFNSLVLAILHASGHEMKLDESVQKLVGKVSKPMRFETFISLSCHNCPDVVQALNQFALLNPNISAEMIDGGLFPELIAERDIQGVPSVYLNGELFGTGKVDAAQLLDKLIELEPRITAATLADQPALPLQDVTVVGGGPAGVAAAIYSARKGLKVTLIADRMGGQVKDTMGIENLISVPKTTGPELVGAMQSHLDDYDITIKENLRVTRVETGNVKTLTLSSGEAITTRTLILATGARWKELGVPGEKENIGNGVAYCPHCDGPFFKGRDVAVIGGGNSGVEAALDLAGIVRSVTVYEFQSDLQADRILVDQLEARDNISVRTNAATREILADGGKVHAIDYEDRSTGEVHRDQQAGVFIQIGLIPNSQVVVDLLETRPWGEIVINEKCETSEPGIFACGDVTTVPYKQIVVAMGEGSKAALAAFEYLLTHQVDAEPLAEAAA